MVMSINERFELIKRNTEEIVKEDELRDLLKKKKNPVVYWGTSVTGKPSIAYFFPLLKLSDFSKAGFKVKVLLADLHGSLDGTPWNVLEKRLGTWGRTCDVRWRKWAKGVTEFYQTQRVST